MPVHALVTFSSRLHDVLELYDVCMYFLSPRAYEPLLSPSNDQYTGQQWPSKAKKRSVHKDKFNGIRHNQDSRACFLSSRAHTYYIWGTCMQEWKINTWINIKI